MKYKELQAQIEAGLQDGVEYSIAYHEGVKNIVNPKQESFFDFILGEMLESVYLLGFDVDDFIEQFGEYCLDNGNVNLLIVRYYLSKKLDVENKRHSVKKSLLEQYIFIIRYLLDKSFINNECEIFPIFSEKFNVDGNRIVKLRLTELHQLGILKSKRVNKQEGGRLVPIGIEYRLMEG